MEGPTPLVYFKDEIKEAIAHCLLGFILCKALGKWALWVNGLESQFWDCTADEQSGESKGGGEREKEREKEGEKEKLI